MGRPSPTVASIEAAFFALTNMTACFGSSIPRRFLSKGVNTVRFDQDHVGSSNRVPYADTCLKKYGSQHIWRTSSSRPARKLEIQHARLLVG